MILAFAGGANSYAARAPWTSSRIVGTPEPPAPYVAAAAWPDVEFDTATDLVLGPDGQRLFVAERWGRIWSFDPRHPERPRELFANLAALFPEFPKLEIYSLAFHPQFATTREVFIRTRMVEESADGSRILRFRVPTGSSFAIDPATLVTVLTFRSGSHAGGNMLFGPDRFLYVTTGDAGPASPPDIHDTGQSLDDLEAAILRLDIDRRGNGREYGIPSDNPFVDLPGARAELWAYGLRNPWKIAFRPGTSELWAGDVGWEMWELIHRIERGGNYGWSIAEGSQPVRPTAKRGAAPILPPIVAHPHSEAASITGGFFYTGTRLPELRGAYIYGDYVTGRIWALWHDGAKITQRRELARTAAKIVSFGVGADGELYFSDFGERRPLLRLERNSQPTQTERFPQRLSETGLFADTATQRPQPGVVPYRIHAAQWLDGAQAEHWIAMPGTAAASARNERRGPSRRVRATVGTGTVFARTLSLEFRSGDPASRRRIETRVLHFAGGDWHAYTYRWNEQQTDASLVSSEGDTTTFLVTDPLAPGGSRRLEWRFPHQAECLRCHNSEAGRVLGFRPGNVDLESLVRGEIVDAEFAAAAQLHSLVALNDEAAPLERRARSWLHVNCAHCHRHQGGGSGAFRINIEEPTASTLLDTLPLQGDFGLRGSRLLEPGAPERSVLLYRIAKSGPGHMPQLGASTTDTRALRVLWEWIAGEAPAAPAPNPAAITDPITAMLAVRRLDDPGAPPDVRVGLLAAGRKATLPEVRALFDRFIPDAERAATLGSNIDADAIMKLKGDPARGAALLSEAGCIACHTFERQGRELGPDLTHIGKRLSRAELLESIIHPSRAIAPEYAAVSLELNDGSTQVGFIRNQHGDRIEFRTVGGERLELAITQIRQRTPLPASMMPEGLLGSLTAQQAADLLAALADTRAAESGR